MNNCDYVQGGTQCHLWKNHEGWEHRLWHTLEQFHVAQKPLVSLTEQNSPLLKEESKFEPSTRDHAKKTRKDVHFQI